MAEFVIQKVNGERRWFGTFSNNARDREGEIVAKAALEEVVQREKAAGHYPPLQFFHIDYPMGQTDFYTVTDGLLTATGSFNETDPVAKTFADYVEAHPESIDGSGWGCSWRFYASPTTDGVFQQVKAIDEFTFLPLSRAANRFTEFSTEVFKMALSDEQRKALEIVLAAPELVATVEQTVAARNTSKALDEAGVQRKDVTEPAPETPAEPVAEEKAKPAPADEPANGDTGKCPECGAPMKGGKCVKCGATAPKKPTGKSMDEARPLTWADLPGVKQFIELAIADGIKAVKDEQEKAAAEYNKNFEVLSKAVVTLSEVVGKVEAEEKALAETNVMPRLSAQYLKSISATAADATVVDQADPLKQAQPASESITEFFNR